jgi:alkyldihydroxyacetonephosphate synthase
VGTRSWWGWGDEEAHLGAEERDGLAALLAERFPGHALSEVRPVDPVAVAPPPALEVPDGLDVATSVDAADRARHARGNAFVDVVRAVEGSLGRWPEAVLRPADADEVERVLDWAAGAGVAVVPYGGGSSVVGGVTPDPDGPPVVSLDLERLAGVLEVDEVSRHARVAAGTYGPAVNEGLAPHGLTFRHFPQSWEFSTLGGWVVTRAGGHFATGPTHVDDLVAAVSAVTPSGRWESRRLPGSGAGPSPDRLLLGSEGTLGIVTDAWVRVQERPRFRGTATVSFPDLPTGLRGLRALAQSGLEPANARLLDPTEAALNGAGDGTAAVLALGFESADHALGPWLDRALELCRDHAGSVTAGPRLTEGDRTGTAEGGAAAWRASFLRAPYLRDALVLLGMVVETFETAITWDRVDGFVADVVAATTAAATEALGSCAVSVRVTHAYPDGCAPYVTVIAPGRPGERVAQWEAVKAAASEAILAGGGTITHHHAVGRTHVPWYERQVPAPFRAALGAAKAVLDPAGVCNPGVLGLGAAGGAP